LESFAGVISYFSIAFTQLSDIMPPKHRAASYGLYHGSFMAGIAIAPFFATLMGHVQIAIFSSAVRMVALIMAIFFMPETLPTESRLAAVAAVQAAYNDQRGKGTSGTCKIFTALLQPLLKMTILLRSSSLILVSFGAFAGKMVFSADLTLFFYYIESNLGVMDKDVAGMMFTAGVCGVLLQAGFFKYLISLLGERRLLIACFCSGTIHNLVYGLAPSKEFLYVGICLSGFTNLNSALLASVASRSVARTEQGQVQGALFGLTSLAEGIGPIGFNFVSRNWHTFGPGTMFVVGAMLYSVGMVAVALVPPKKVGTVDAGMEQEEDEGGSSSRDYDGRLGEREVLLP
jgi:MFS transporter, DHA1 family, tetracycline resistance protein